MSQLTQFILSRAKPLAMPVLTYPGAALIGRTVKDMATDPQVQFEAIVALHKKFRTPVVLGAMDLSVEAEAFGCEIMMGDEEVPTVIGRLVTNRAEAEALRVPEVGARRTRVALESIRLLKTLTDRPLVLAGMVGPFSLAARIFGVSEALGLTVEDPDLLEVLLDKSTRYLSAYAQAFKALGADGVVMAEPTAGLMSPRALATYSSAYVKQIVEAVDDEAFTLIYHNCAAKMLHLPNVLASGAKMFHFGAPMDLTAALAQVPADIILCGNLDPAAVFVRGTPEEVKAASRKLLEAAAGRRNFVLSSGCDVPPRTPMASLEAFFAQG